MSAISTQFGAVAVDELIRVYNNHKASNLRAQEKRKQWIQTDEGKQYNRTRAKNYYQKNKEAILEKRKTMYADKKEFQRLVNRQDQQLTQSSE